MKMIKLLCEIWILIGFHEMCETKINEKSQKDLFVQKFSAYQILFQIYENDLIFCVVLLIRKWKENHQYIWSRD